jgi:RNA polymerase sigma factor (sigma-70 family)
MVDRDPHDRDPRDRDPHDRDPHESDPRDRDPHDRDPHDRDPHDRDVALHRRLTECDECALNEAYDEHSAIVYGLARRILCDPVAAEDVLQDVFLRLWLRPQDYEPAQGGLRARLSAAARQRAIDYLRWLHAARQCLEKLAADIPHATDAAELVIHSVQEKHIRAAVNALPEVQRAAILLAYYGGLSYRQVAQRLGIPEGTAKSRLRGALRSLAYRLRQVGVV